MEQSTGLTVKIISRGQFVPFPKSPWSMKLLPPSIGFEYSHRKLNICHIAASLNDVGCKKSVVVVMEDPASPFFLSYKPHQISIDFLLRDITVMLTIEANGKNPIGHLQPDNATAMPIRFALST